MRLEDCSFEEAKRLRDRRERHRKSKGFRNYQKEYRRREETRKRRREIMRARRYPHRVIVENYIGRRLLQEEHIHHINKNREDNSINNLFLTTNEEHTKLHQSGKSHLVKSNIGDQAP